MNSSLWDDLLGVGQEEGGEKNDIYNPQKFMCAYIAGADADNDGRLSWKEFPGPKGKKSISPWIYFRNLFEEMDTDSDAQITQPEMDEWHVKEYGEEQSESLSDDENWAFCHTFSPVCAKNWEVACTFSLSFRDLSLADVDRRNRHRSGFGW